MKDSDELELMGDSDELELMGDSDELELIGNSDELELMDDSDELELMDDSDELELLAGIEELKWAEGKASPPAFLPPPPHATKLEMKKLIKTALTKESNCIIDILVSGYCTTESVDIDATGIIHKYRSLVESLPANLSIRHSKR